MEEQQCLLCESDASYSFCDGSKQFICVHCGEFRITHKAEKQLDKIGNPERRKAEYSRLAQKSDEKMILLIELEAPTAEQEPPQLKAELKERKSLPICRDR